MTTWPDRHGVITRQYLQQLHLRPSSARTYQPMLEQFQDYVVAHSPERFVSRQIFESWLRHRASFSSADTILQRIGPIDRFLDWLVNRQLISSNPLADLRRELGTRNTAAIVRALLSSDSEKALAALRPARRFASHLGPLMQSHVLLMRSLGLRYITQELQLLRFDRFLQERPDATGQSVFALIREWGEKNPVPQHLVECAQVGRMVARAIQRENDAVVVPALDQRLNQQVRRGQRRPHIYSEAEIGSLLNAARSFPSPETPIRPLMLYTILVLAYCMGLRIGEIVRLTVGDLNLDAQTIEIRETKFFKSRRLPFTHSVAASLRAYLVARSQEDAPADSSAPLFWCRSVERAYGYVTIRALLLQVIRKAGLKPLSGRVGPRIHDLRHAFVVNRIVAWYREGVNAQARLPYLATYLGHKDIHSTLVYITVTEELMQQASERFRSYGAHVLRSAEGGDACQ
jgi:site-specific recombinase XerD